MKEMYTSQFHTYTCRVVQALLVIPVQNHTEILELVCMMNHAMFYEMWDEFKEYSAKLHYFVEQAETLMEAEQDYDDSHEGDCLNDFIDIPQDATLDEIQEACREDEDYVMCMNCGSLYSGNSHTCPID